MINKTSKTRLSRATKEIDGNKKHKIGESLNEMRRHHDAGLHLAPSFLGSISLNVDTKDTGTYKTNSSRVESK